MIVAKGAQLGVQRVVMHVGAPLGRFKTVKQPLFALSAQLFFTNCICCDTAAAGYDSIKGLQTGKVPCKACPSGFYNPLTASKSIAECTGCSSGNYQDQAGQSNCKSCEVGRFRESAQRCSECKPGMFQAQSGQTACKLCTAGMFQNKTMQITCIPCGEGTVQDQQGMTSCVNCEAGKYQSQKSRTRCTSCSKGKFAANVSQIACISCTQGTYQPASSSAYCDKCPAGRYSDGEEAVECKSCGSGKFNLATGITSIKLCSCAAGWSGENCDLAACDDTLSFVSLGLLLIEASYPEELRERGGMPDRILSKWTTTFQVNSILRTADVNGDGNLDVAEAINALRTVNVNVPQSVVAKGIIWAVAAASNNFEPQTNAYSIQGIVHDAVSSFIQTGTFYGYKFDDADSTALFDASATYPNSTWDQKACENDINSGISLKWKVRAIGQSNLYQQCGYMNGALLPRTSFNDRLTTAADCVQEANRTKTCVFKDPTNIAQSNRKRLYCVYAFFCDGNDCKNKKATPGFTRFVCRTGLSFDGKPADVFPAYSTMEGVQFKWLDTYTKEAGFRIFRDSFTGNQSLGQLIADIPNSIPSCGQQFAPLLFSDRETGQFPGRRVSYIVAAVNSTSGATMDGTRILYTQPWVSTLSATVRTDAGKAPVKDVEIVIEHLVEKNQATISDTTFGNITLNTSAAGSISAEIRVADAAKWFQPSQDFLLTPSKCTDTGNGAWLGDNYLTRKCRGTLHTFEPKFTKLSATHMFPGEVAFTDTTSYAIKGYIIYGDSATPGNTIFRGDYNANDWMSPKSCPTFFKDMCYCPVGVSSLRLELIASTGHSNEVTNVTTSADGFFVSTMDMNQRYKIHFEGFNGHLFELWSVKNGGFNETKKWTTDFELVASANKTPSFTFTATGDMNFVFVDVQARNLSIEVLGGDSGMEFISGQRVLIQRAACGYSKELVTFKGKATSKNVIPTGLTVLIPDNEAGLPRCSGFVRNQSRPVTQACRVPVPQISSTSLRLPCATSPFTYVDQYFAAVGSPPREIDLGQGEATASFTFVAPLCLKAVVIAAPSKDRVLQNITKCGNGVSDRMWPPAWVTNTGAERMQEVLLLNPPTIDSGFKDSEFGKADGIDERAIFCEGDMFNISFSLVEVYPSNSIGLVCDWPEDYDSGACTLQYDPENDFNPTLKPKFGLKSTLPSSKFNISIDFFDGISGLSPNSTIYDPSVSWGFVHSMVPADPNPFAPFTNIFEAVFTRETHGGADNVAFVRRAVTLGVIPESVPQLFTVTTNPSLIFAVLHDPPGGSSFATLTEGSSLNVNMQIDGMHAGDFEKSKDISTSSHIAGGYKALVAPFGIGIDKKVFGIDVGLDWAKSTTKPAVSIERANAQSFDISFSFDVELSTSSKPELAGQPSDLILGGGMNLKVLRSIQVKLATGSPNSKTGLCSVFGMTASEWLPGQITTWLMTPYQIEATIGRLQQQYNLQTSTERKSDELERVRSSITNWRAVLAEYRKSIVSSKSSIEEAISSMVEGVHVAANEHGLKNMVAGFNSEMSDENQFMPYILKGLDDLDNLNKGEPRSRGKIQGGEAVSMASKLSDHLDLLSRTNCNGGDAFGIGELCDSVKSMKSRVDVVNKVLAICDFDTGLKPVERFCKTQTKDAKLPQSAFDALGNTDHLVTFAGGGSSTTISYAITQGKHHGQSVAVTGTEESATNFDKSFCLDLLRRRLNAAGRDEPQVDWSRRKLEGEQPAPSSSGSGGGKPDEAGITDSGCRRRRLGFKNTVGHSTSSGSSFSVKLARSASRSDEAMHHVSFTLSDDNDSDFFAVQILNDDVYGTPLFRTMGGISSNPGETGTTKIDSFVKIREIKHHCEGRLSCKDVPFGTPAVIGVVIENLSPLRQENNYKLFMVQSSEPWTDGKDYCGMPGYTGGLVVNSMNGFDLTLPYGQRVVYLTLEPFKSWNQKCLKYNNIQIGLVAASEPVGTVYQYKTKLDPATGKVDILYPKWNSDTGAWIEETTAGSETFSTASVSVSWSETQPQAQTSTSTSPSAPVPAPVAAAPVRSPLVQPATTELTEKIEAHGIPMVFVLISIGGVVFVVGALAVIRNGIFGYLALENLKHQANADGAFSLSTRKDFTAFTGEKERLLSL